MATAKRTLWIETFLQDKLSRPLTDVERAVARFGQKSLTSLKNIGADSIKKLRSEVVQLALVYAGFKGLQFAATAADDTANLARLAETTGDSVRNMSELVGAMALVGLSTGEAQNAIRSLENATRQALKGNVEFGASFEQLNITLTDLEHLAPSQKFERLAQALGKIGSEQERQFRLGQLLPDQYQQLLPVIGRGVDQFDALVTSARQAHATITTGQAEAAKALQSNMASIKLSFDDVIRTITERYGKDFSRLLANIASAIADHSEDIARFVQLIGTGLVKAVDLAGQALIGFVGVIEFFTGPLDGSQAKIKALYAELYRLQSLRNGTGLLLAEGPSKTDLDAQISKIYDQIAAAQKQVSRGLAGSMEDLRQQLLTGLGDLSQSIGASPITKDQAAAIVGAPTQAVLGDVDALIEQVKKQREEMAQLSQTPSRGRVLGSSGPASSVFADSPRVGSGFSDSRESFKRQQQELEQIAALAPTLRPLQDRLLELKRDAAVFELEHARTGAANADLVREAIAKVNEEFEKSQRLITGGDFFAGFKNGARDAVKEWTDFEKAGTQAAQQIVGGGLDNLTSELGAAIAGTKSWKEAWKDWATSVLSDLGRVAARLATVAILKAAGLADGGVVTGGTVPIKVAGAANGAIVTKPTLLMVGEGKSDEAVVPMPRGKIPVELRGRGGGNVTVNVSVQAWDRHDVQRVLLSNKDFLGQLIAQQVGTQAKLSQAITKART